jgi:hypothetical protein
MNRTLRRPMFRMGGSAEGITSGLDAPDINKRGLVDGPGGYSGEEGDDLESRYSRAMDFIQSKRAPRGSNFNDFLISYGLDLASRPKSGNILQQLATSARDPFKEFQSRREMYRSEDDKLSQALAGDIMEQMGKEKVAETEGKYRVEAEKAKPGKQFDIGQGAKIDQLRKKSYEDQLKLENERDAILAIPEEDRTPEQIQRLEQIQRAELPAVQGTLKDLEGGESTLSKIKAAGMSERFNDQVDDLMDTENPATGANYTLQEAFAAVLKIYESMFSGKKDGGRIGYMTGGGADMGMAPVTMDQGTTQDSPVQNLSFEELRSRLPNSITDDIITLIANSEQALVDFANIQTQQDVNAFNQKYEVNLQMPAEA